MRFDWDDLYQEANEWAEAHEDDPLREAVHHLSNLFEVGEDPRLFWRLRNEPEVEVWEEMMEERRKDANNRLREIAVIGFPQERKREWLAEKYIERELGRWLRTLRKPEKVFWPTDESREQDSTPASNEPDWYVCRVRSLLNHLDPEETVKRMCNRADEHTTGGNLRKNIKERLEEHHGLAGKMTADIFCRLVPDEARRLGLEVEEVEEAGK